MSDNVHPIGRGFCYEDLKVGQRFRTHRRTIVEADLAGFVNLTWLTEELFAVEDDTQRAIKGRAVPGALVYSFAEGLLLPSMQDTGLAFLNATLDIKGPTVVGDTIHVRGHSTDFVQQVASLALDGAPVREGAPPQALGVRLEARARPGDRVYRVSW